MDSLIHSQEWRNTTLGQALSCGYKAEYDPVRSLSYSVFPAPYIITAWPPTRHPTPPHISHTASQLCSLPTVPSLFVTTSVALPCSNYPRHPLSLIHLSHFYSSFKTWIKSHFLSECFSNHPTSLPCLLSYGLAISNVAVIFGTTT